MIQKIQNTINNSKIQNSDTIDINKAQNQEEKKSAFERLDSVEISNTKPSDEWEIRKKTWNRVTIYETFSGECDLVHKIRNMYQEYYAGNKTAEDVKQEFYNVVNKIQKFDEELGVVATDDAEHYGKIVSDVNRIFKQMSVSAIFSANQAEGKALANEYGEPGNKNFLYYNSDYYYKSEEINDMVFQCATELTEKAGVELSTKAGAVKRDIYENFNTYWKASAQELYGDMLDTNIKPPKGFTFLYKEMPFTRKQVEELDMGNKTIYDSLLKVTYGDWSTENYVNLKYGADEFKGYTIFELLDTAGSIKRDDLLIPFLKNFNIHRATYNNHYLYNLGYFN